MSARSLRDQVAIEDAGTEAFDTSLGGAFDAFRTITPQEVADLATCANHLSDIGFAGSRGVPCGQSRHGNGAWNCLSRRIAAAKMKAGIS